MNPTLSVLRVFVALLTVGGVLLAPTESRGRAAAAVVDTWSEPAPGLRHLHRQVTGSTPQNIHALVIDLSDPHVQIGVGMAARWEEGVGERTSSIAGRHGAFAAVNGDYFWAGRPLGLTVRDGEVVTPNTFGRSGIGVSTGNSGIVGKHNVDGAAIPGWLDTFVGGGPVFVANGRAFWNVDNENQTINGEYFSSPSSYSGRGPMTAGGVSQDQKTMILVVADGRQPGFASGLTPLEMGELLIELGAWTAVRLDGGGSSTFYLDGGVLNSPSDGSERAVGNALLIYNSLPEPSGAAMVGLLLIALRRRRS